MKAQQARVAPQQYYYGTTVSGTQSMTDMINAIMPLFLIMMMMGMLMPMMKGIAQQS